MASTAQRLVEKLGLNPSRVHLDRVAAQAGAVGKDPSFRVLDAGAGSAPYRHHFAAVTYETADFLGADKDYAVPTYQCDLVDIPVEDGRFDLVFCSQTLEHLPDPLAALVEMRRVLKPDGQLWITAPLFYAEHEVPYDFYRYTRYGLTYLAEKAGFRVASLEPLEGYYATLSYQLLTAARVLPPLWLPVRLLFGLIAVILARRDAAAPRRDIGMCKNYRCVLVPA